GSPASGKGSARGCSRTCRPGSECRATGARGAVPPAVRLPAEGEPGDDLVTGPATRPLAEEGVDERDLGDLPVTAAERVEDAQPGGGVVASGQPGEREVRAEPGAVWGAAGGVRGRAGARRERVEWPVFRLVDARPQDLRAFHGRERPRPGQAQPEGFVFAGHRLQPVGELVETPVIHVGAEGQREMPLRRVSPGQPRPRLEESLELPPDLVRWQYRHE